MPFSHWATERQKKVQVRNDSDSTLSVQLLPAFPVTLQVACAGLRFPTDGLEAREASS